MEENEPIYKNGRKYFLDDLLPTIKNDAWMKITQDLLYRKTHFDLWRLDLHEFLALPEHDLETFCRKLILSATEWLRQIHFDLWFARTLFTGNGWDPYILESLINLTTTTLNSFGGEKYYFGRIYHYCRSQASLIDLAKRFKEQRSMVNNDFRLFVVHVEYGKKERSISKPRMGLEEGDKIPAATFQELLIQNEIIKRRNQSLKPRFYSEEDQELNLESDMFILKILEMFREKLEQFVKKIPDGEVPTGYWHSRMLVVVRDPDTGIFVTGGTQPAATLENDPLGLVALNICRIRIGEDYASIIHKCSGSVWRDVKKYESDRKTGTPSKKLFESFSDANQKSSHDGIPSSQNKIRCWAFTDGFVPRAPCTRCQSIYSEWTLYDKPDTCENWINGLISDLRSGTIKYRSGEHKFPCTYCAETVAAAQLHALRCGVLTLVLSKDTDELKASYRRNVVVAKADNTPVVGAGDKPVVGAYGKPVAWTLAGFVAAFVMGILCSYMFLCGYGS